MTKEQEFHEKNEKNTVQRIKGAFLQAKKKIGTIIIGLSSVPVIVSYATKNIPEYIQQESKRSEIQKISQLSDFQNLGDILNRYYDDTEEFGTSISKLSSDLLTGQADYFQEDKILDGIKKESNNQDISHRICENFLGAINSNREEAFKSGAEVFYSENLSDFRRIHRFYESLGIMIDNSAIEFDLIFDLIFFPGRFSENGDYLPLENPIIEINDCLSRNWFDISEQACNENSNNEAKCLLDHGGYIKKLSYNYRNSRQKLKTGKFTVIKGQCFYPFDRQDFDEKLPYWLLPYPSDKTIFDVLLEPFEWFKSQIKPAKQSPCSIHESIKDDGEINQNTFLNSENLRN